MNLTRYGFRGKRALLLGLLPALLFGGCSTTKYREAADKAAYSIIESKSKAVPGMVDQFTIDQDPAQDPLAGLPERAEPDAALGAEEQSEVGAKIINLENALNLAFTRNRNYQNEKESLYLQALALTLDRHQYTPIFSGGGGIQQNSFTTERLAPSDFAAALASAREVIAGIEGVTGSPAELLQASADLVEQAGVVARIPDTQLEVNRENNVEGAGNAGIDLLLKGGGRLAVAFTTNFLSFITGDTATTRTSLLSAVFSQPLLRGAGADVAAERLTQSERDVLYGVRNFTRFRQEFAVDICTQYYNVLQQRDILMNSYRSYQNFQKNVELTRALAAEGRKTLSDLGRLEQEVLSNETQWINAVRRYKELLDEFKITMGLSTDAQVVLDSSELDLLRKEGLMHPKIEVDDAVQVALVSRLDLYNAQGRTEDSARQVKVAANNLKADLDLVATADVPSRGATGYNRLEFDRTRYGIGLNADLPLERTSERNSYRASLIAHERALREYTLNVDTVKLDVRAAWRNLDQALRNYQNALQSVDLNQRRVEEQQLLAELGRATAIDQVDAQNALTQAQNSLTAALVGHTLSRLSFWRDMGILYIKEGGHWEDVSDQFVLVPASETGQALEQAGESAPAAPPATAVQDDPTVQGDAGPMPTESASGAPEAPVIKVEESQPKSEDAPPPVVEPAPMPGEEAGAAAEPK